MVALGLFSAKKVLHCAVCGKDLHRHKYKPQAEWKIEGYLCSDCHIEKTKEFATKPSEPDSCAVCGGELGDIAVKPRWQWEMQAGTLLCQQCFNKKDAEHNKKLNFCAVCGTKIGFIRYNPKPAWKIEGQMCRSCWDRRNASKD
jgi:uncharacterized CHY-type Zn-finger protein